MYRSNSLRYVVHAHRARPNNEICFCLIVHSIFIFLSIFNVQQYSPVVMSQNVKGKTIILANANNPQQKTIILRSVGADGNTILQQVPFSGLQNITTQQTQQQQPQQQQQIPALVPTSYVITSDNSPQVCI